MTKSSKAKSSKIFKSPNILIFIAVFAVIGVIALISSHAASPAISIETETATVSAPAVAISGDSTASTGSYVQFKAASSNSNLLCTWPGIANQKYPCASDTGVPLTVTLSAYTGPNPITTDGTTINGKDFGIGTTVYVQASNVTITNSRMGLVYLQSGTNLKVTYSEINGSGTACNGNDAVQYGDYTLDHDKIINFSDGPRDSGNNITITNNYIVVCYNAGDHADGIQAVGGGKNVLIRHNTIDSTNRPNGNAAIFLSDATGGGGTTTVDNNYLGGGQYVLQPKADDAPAGSVYLVTNNIIANNSWALGPCNVTTNSVSTVTLSNNRLDTGVLISGCN